MKRSAYAEGSHVSDGEIRGVLTEAFQDPYQIEAKTVMMVGGVERVVVGISVASHECLALEISPILDAPNRKASQAMFYITVKRFALVSESDYGTARKILTRFIIFLEKLEQYDSTQGKYTLNFSHKPTYLDILYALIHGKSEFEDIGFAECDLGFKQRVCDVDFATYLTTDVLTSYQKFSKFLMPFKTTSEYFSAVMNRIEQLNAREHFSAAISEIPKPAAANAEELHLYLVQIQFHARKTEKLFSKIFVDIERKTAVKAPDPNAVLVPCSRTTKSQSHSRPTSPRGFATNEINFFASLLFPKEKKKRLEPTMPPLICLGVSEEQRLKWLHEEEAEAERQRQQAADKAEEAERQRQQAVQEWNDRLTAAVRAVPAAVYYRAPIFGSEAFIAQREREKEFAKQKRGLT